VKGLGARDAAQHATLDRFEMLGDRSEATNAWINGSRHLNLNFNNSPRANTSILTSCAQ
jgi:hypothetical protein